MAAGDGFRVGGGSGGGCYPFSMKRTLLRSASPGPFRADQIRPGDPYELSNGHPIFCPPAGGQGAKATSVGADVLASDPAVQDVGVDTGFSPSPEILRAPDIAVGNIPDQPGWVHGAPLLAVEYADTGQDEGDLAIKIEELLAAGTRFIWVVRLTGPRRVEVHQAGAGMNIARPGEQLEAPGILANPVPVEALYDREVGREVVFRNLLQREGYASLDAVRAEELRTAIVEVLTARGLAANEDLRAALAGVSDPDLLRRLLAQAATATSPAEMLAAFEG
jgi:Uma2 family endonuclease